MKLSQETYERAKERPRAADQPELLNLPAPMTANRAKDFNKCKRCQVECDYCLIPTSN